MLDARVKIDYDSPSKKLEEPERMLKVVVEKCAGCQRELGSCR